MEKTLERLPDIRPTLPFQFSILHFPLQLSLLPAFFHTSPKSNTGFLRNPYFCRMTTPQFSKNALIFVLITICIDSIGLGIIIPSLPLLIADAAHTTVEASSKYSGLVLSTYAFMQFIFSPLIGNLS